MSPIVPGDREVPRPDWRELEGVALWKAYVRGFSLFLGVAGALGLAWTIVLGTLRFLLGGLP